MALIMAFIFRAFIIEAFIIPTGSMAATLYGKHATITCEDCGWEFAYGLADQGQSGHPVRRTVGPTSVAVCQNCGHPNTNLTVHDFAGPQGNAEKGDRILVLKWPLDLGLAQLGPQRWDVTVFKDPGSTGTTPGGRYLAPQNFIKRLVGLPNEVLEITDGDIYTVPVAELSDPARRALQAARRLKYESRRDSAGVETLASRRAVESSEASLRRELDAKLRIRRKTPAAQRALWTLVYSHDYPPRHLDPGQPYWQPPEGDVGVWDVSTPKIKCDSLGAESGVLRFAGKEINDQTSYNLNVNGHYRWHRVSDLRLSFVLVPRAGQGVLRLALSKRDHTFWALIQANGTVALFQTRGQQPAEGDTPLASHVLGALSPGEPVRVAFENVDHRVSLRVNGIEVLATTDEQYAPDLAALRAAGDYESAAPRLLAYDLQFELWHLALKRDVHYGSLKNERNVPMAARTAWGTEGKPIWLREGEFFMLGDNSGASKDSRLWSEPGAHLSGRRQDYQMGTVPRDQLIGRAFFVYWPSGHRSDVLPFLKDFGLIPNFGRMRWIY
ncbi:MAG: S26 family signal peptidase [Phycisphaerae bacterium]